MKCDCINCKLSSSLGCIIESSRKDAEKFNVDPLAHLIMASVAVAHNLGISPEDYVRACLMHFNGWVEVTDVDGVPDAIAAVLPEPEHRGPVMVLIVQGSDGEPGEDESPENVH